MYRFLKLSVVTGLSLLSSLAVADTCSTIEAVAPSVDVTYRFNPSYTTTSKEYWSSTCAALKPSCIVYPTSARDVSAILGVIRGNGSDPGAEKFAVKSGGHNPNNYFSSVDDGPLISTEKLDHVILNPDTGVVRVGPGLRWDELADSLDGSGWSAVGGRIGNVGVGGYMLGGGLSFMSQEYGWAASSILEFEVVVANGTIITASSSKNQGLFRALKGGGNNFGIVTSFTVQAHKQGDIYGGVMVFPHSEETDAKILKAIQDFTLYNDDDKAAVIPTAERAGGGLVDTWIMFVFYDGPEPPEHVFKNFTEISHIVDSRKTRSMAEFLSDNNWAVLKGQAYVIGTETIPLPDPSSDIALGMLPTIHEHWRNVTSEVDHILGIVASIAFQPFPRRIAQVAREKGGDLIDFDDDVDRIIIELNYSFSIKSDYDVIDQTLQDTYSGVRNRVLEWQKEGSLPDAYLPLFMNDAFFRQDYFSRLRPKYAELAKSLAEELDPNGLFRDRTGGWKP